MVSQRRFAGVRGRDRSAGLARVVDDSFQAVIAGAVVIVLLTSGLLAWLALVSRPNVQQEERGLQALQAQQTAMLDQETGVRGYLSTGESNFLDPYRKGAQALPAVDRSLSALASDHRLTDAIIAVRVAEERWVDSWAQTAVREDGVDRTNSATLDAFLLEGKSLFDAYRAAVHEAEKLTSRNLRRDRQLQGLALQGVTGLAVAVALMTLRTAVVRRRTLRRDVLQPVAAILEGLQQVGVGNLAHRVESKGPRELVDVVDGVNAMTVLLAQAHFAGQAREDQVLRQAQQLKSLLAMVREIGGSLNLRYVLVSIVEGVSAITGAVRVSVWLLDEQSGLLHLAGDSDASRIGSAEPVELGSGITGRAAKFGRALSEPVDDGSGALALVVPLVVGARVIGTLELRLHVALPDDELEVIETLSVHAATAVEAARLHQSTSHASEHDSLTRLANRRRLETDLELECDRSARYGRPLAFIMIDLDHFKRLNDSHGHPYGDDVLQGVAALIDETLRSTDTAYRYGGEELAVLVRESDVAGAMLLAERLRSRIETRFARTGHSGVTASFGVAEMPSDAATPAALVAASDAALYAAKHAGRNCVRSASDLSVPRARTGEAAGVLAGE